MLRKAGPPARVLAGAVAEEAQDIFTITTHPFGMFTPKRVPQGVLNATSYFQGAMMDLLDGLRCKIWVDGVFFFAGTEDEPLDSTLDGILARLESVGLLAAANRCAFSFLVNLCGVGKCIHALRLA